MDELVDIASTEIGTQKINLNSSVCRPTVETVFGSRFSIVSRLCWVQHWLTCVHCSSQYCQYRHHSVYRPTNGISLFWLCSVCWARPVDRISWCRRNSRRRDNISRTANSWAVHRIPGLAAASKSTRNSRAPISVRSPTDRWARILLHRCPFVSPANVWWHWCSAVVRHCRGRLPSLPNRRLFRFRLDFLGKSKLKVINWFRLTIIVFHIPANVLQKIVHFTRIIQF